MFEVSMTKRAEKGRAKMPADQVLLLAQLVEWPPFPQVGSLLGRD
jgi:hypothetical protein